MSKTKKNYILNSVAVDLGCTSSCKRPKITSILHPNRPKVHRSRSSSSSAASPSSWSTTTTTSSSSDVVSELKSTRAPFSRIGGGSVAVEKDSDDPYLDFRHSMLQMIIEKQIYSKDDLKELLNCFLELNSPYYHGVIVRAFMEIWNGVYSVSPKPNS